ncbi:MAG TPA: hypothetical protein VGD10_11360 [Allosphingosinicella sp.]|uniref:hypothetical protein n=1 Tax=Allosphingosinicella sp. TaxID=2823234 RepID=UPI002ED7CBC1
MKKFVSVTVAAVMALSIGAPATAQNGKSAKTPANWSYEIKNGQRVPKANRVTNADGSWTEEIKQGNCTVTRTGRDGEVREVRTCG